MASSFTWLDHSERDRRRAMELIASLREQGTLDELGIGTVRDAFANLLFPGTSTIQTRARYLLFVPWIYQLLEAKKVPSAQISRAARELEITLIDALAASPDPQGTIGRRSRKELQRLPSNIYWLALETFGIRLYKHSQEDYHASLDHYYARAQRRVLRTDDGELLERNGHANWDPALPPCPARFPRRAAFDLTADEARYLREQIIYSQQRSLLAFLLDRRLSAPAVQFPWLHPHYGVFDEHLKAQLQHAKIFAETIYGAILLYNLMLAEKAAHEQLIAKYQHELGLWAEATSGSDALWGWDTNDFWATAAGGKTGISEATRQFINRWLALARDRAVLPRIATDRGARELIYLRERRLKHALARLDNGGALDVWLRTGAAGTRPLQFRWPVAWRIVEDILHGLGAADA